LALLAALLSAGDSEYKMPKPGFNMFSKPQDVQLGKEASEEVEKKIEILKDKHVTGYIERLGHSLIKLPEADAEDFHYTFKVVSDDNINAFSLPGGPVYVNTGVILVVDNEAQLAGVLGHEISHVALRHGTNQVSKTGLIELPAILPTLVAGKHGRILSALMAKGIGLGASSVLLKFSRTNESQADALGTKMIYEAGYDPIELARFFEKLEEQNRRGNSRLAEFLSDHPNPGNRVKAVEEEVGHFVPRQYTANTGQFSRIKAMVHPKPKPPEPSGQVVK
jgi:predicted Zn-dependent protease